MHTCHSDGTNSPAELLEVVRSKNLAAFSVTDHDTLDGFKEVSRLLTNDDPELLPGLEMSVSIENGDCHLLAYGFDVENQQLSAALKQLQEDRNKRAKLMVERLNELGVPLSFDRVREAAVGTVIGRPHVAEAMAAAGVVGSYNEAFVRYIGNGKPANIPKENFAPSEAIDLVHQAGGVIVMAHPIIDGNIRFIEMLAGMGMDGVEHYHPVHSAGDIERLKEISRRLRLIGTGGSDYHGREGNFSSVGSQNVPIQYLEDIKQRAKIMRERT